MIICLSILDLSGEDGVELFFGNEAISVSVGSFDQLFQFGLGDVVAEIIGNSSEVLDGDESGFLVVEKSEDFVNVGAGVLVVDSLGHEAEPLSEIDVSVAVGIEVGNHLEDGTTLALKSERGHGGLEF